MQRGNGPGAPGPGFPRGSAGGGGAAGMRTPGMVVGFVPSCSGGVVWFWGAGRGVQGVVLCAFPALHPGGVGWGGFGMVESPPHPKPPSPSQVVPRLLWGRVGVGIGLVWEQPLGCCGAEFGVGFDLV